MGDAERFRAKIAGNRTCVGMVVSMTDPAVCETCAAAGYDFVWIDMEHQPITIETAYRHVAALRGTETSALIRVPYSDPNIIKPILDLAPTGIIVPQIRTAKEAADAVSACRYPPLGCRGFGPRSGMRYGALGAAEYLKTANRDILVMVQIEHIDAVQNIEAILATPGLDGICIGPCDLSGSMGLLGQTDHPEVQAAIDRVLQVSAGKGLLVGVATGYSPESAARWIQRGVQWICLNGDWIYIFEGSKTVVGGVREIDDRRKG